MTDTFQDALTLPGAAGLPPRFFDRFVFNLHPEACAPSVIVGLGVYPVEDVVDGFAIVVTQKEQRNLRQLLLHKTGQALRRIEERQKPSMIPTAA